MAAGVITSARILRPDSTRRVEEAGSESVNRKHPGQISLIVGTDARLLQGDQDVVFLPAATVAHPSAHRPTD